MAGWRWISDGSQAVTSVRLSEGRDYKRCVEFLVEAEKGGVWRRVAGGTTIGPMLEIAIEPVTAPTASACR